MEKELLKIAELLASRIPARAYPVYQPDDILGSEEASVVLHCTPEALDQYVTLKGLPYYKAGVKRLFIYSDIVEWLRTRNKTRAVADPEGYAESRTHDNSIEGLFRKSKAKKAVR